MSILNSNNFLYKTVDGVKQFFSPLVNASTVVLEDGSRLEKDGKIHTDTADDSKKLGGKEPKYYIQPRNLLDNSDFRNPVNQRGVTNGWVVSPYSCFIDRWISDSANSETVSIGVEGVKLSGAWMHQKLLGVKDGAIVTAAVCIDGSIHVVSGIVTYNSDNSWKRCIGNNDDNILIDTANGMLSFLIIQNGKFVQWAALYEGEYTADNLPPYVPKGYGAELVECLRYFERIKTTTTHHVFCSGCIGKTTKALCQLYYTKKRMYLPTVTYGGTFHLGGATTFSNVTFGNIAIQNDTGINIDINITGGTVGQAVILQATDTNAYFDVNADL